MLVVGIFLSHANILSASHIVGMDLKYRFVSGSQYEITCVVYGDCGAASAGAFDGLYNASAEINVFDGGSHIACVSLALSPPDSGENIAKYVMCPSDTNNTTCTNTSNPYPGVKKFVYKGTYDVPHTSHYWRFIFAGNLTSNTAGRAAAITNIVSPGSTRTELVDTLDNTVANNSSPNLSLEPILFFCINNNDTYNPIAVDPDGDSLRFQLIPGMTTNNSACPTSGGTQVSYVSGLSGSNPMQVNTGAFSLDPGTGEIDFNPSAIQRAMVVYNMREFRDGVFIGSSQREMNFIVVSCSVTPPTATVTGAAGGVVGPDSTHFQVCGNSGPFSFTINPHESDTSNKIYVTPIGIPAGATYTITGDSTNAPHCTFSWNSTGVAPGTYTFYLKIQDNNCPVNGESVIAFNVVITAMSSAINGDNVFCSGVSGTLSNANSGGIWSSSNASVAVIDPSTGVVNPVGPGVSTITYSMNSWGCATSEVITVNPSPNPISGPTQICIGTPATYTDVGTWGGTWQFSNTAASVNSSGIVTSFSTGVDTLYFRLANGCFAQQVITINPTPSAITGNSVLCTGHSILLSQSTSGGNWVATNTHASIDADGVVTANSAGLDTVVYHIGACAVSAVLTVNQSPAPISGMSGLCQGASIYLVDTTAGGHWTSSPTAAYSVNGFGLVFGLAQGTGIVTYTTTNGCYQVLNITVFPKPVISGTDSGCTAVHTLVNTSVGGGTWTLSNSSLASIAAAGSSNAVVTGIAQGMDTVFYVSPDGCKDTLRYPIHVTVPVSITVTDSPTVWICYGVPVTFHCEYTNGGVNRQLIWIVNGTMVDTGTSYQYLPLPGDRVNCILISDTVCAQPYPDTSNTAFPLINLNTPTITMASSLGDTLCAGITNTFTISSGDTGVAPVYIWSVNYMPVATNMHSYAYVPSDGDIVTCSMTVDAPCSVPNPAVATDTLHVFAYHNPSLALTATNGGVVCQGDPVTIFPIWTYGGQNPVFYWNVNGAAAGSGSSYSYLPASGDSVSCFIVSDYPCAVPSDTVYQKISITVDPVIVVNITGNPGQLLTAGQNDTLHASVVNGGATPTYKWLLNGIVIPGANYQDVIIPSLSDKDSVTCVVTTGSGTPCEGVQGFNWMIVQVGPLRVGSVGAENSEIRILPNPNSGKFLLEGSMLNSVSSLRIMDMAGRVIYKPASGLNYFLAGLEIELPADISGGVYLLEVEKGGQTHRLPLTVIK